MRHRHTPFLSARRSHRGPEGPANPWITAADSVSSAVDEPEARRDVPLLGPPEPHRAIPTPPAGALLGTRVHLGRPRVWWLGVHGGAGETTLAALMEGTREAEHAWPAVDGEPAAVVLVARTHAYGLDRSQAASTQWAARATPDVRLLGLVLIADAPGRLPAPLQAWSKVLAGGVPRVWHLPWIEPLRLGADPESIRGVRAVRRLLRDVDALTTPDSPPSPAIVEEVPHAAHAAARI